MRRIILTLLVAFITLSASAQQWGPTGYGNNYGRGNNSSDGALSKGYRGMVETGHGLGWNDVGYYTFLCSTTHGYQFNPYLYLGGMVSFGGGEYETWRNNSPYGWYTEWGFKFQIGSDFRVYMSKGRLAPFVGTQFGFDMCGDNAFVLLNGQLGLRCALKNNIGLNFSVQVGPTCYFQYGDVLFKLGFEF